MRGAGFSDDVIPGLLKVYRRICGYSNALEGWRFFDGIPEMLEALKEKGVKIALATSKPYEFSIKILKHFDLYKYFDFFGAATMDGRISKKEDVIAHLLEEMGVDNKEEILRVGDRHHDIDGAKANGLRSGCVLWGYGSKEELQNAGADHILAGPSEILKLF